ncbi:hypothetical protein KSS87_023888 [Heliosperma pusillum]|nr:hypothetical protein KSS87_023888 [Heliosperma pusillum]
MVDSKVTDSYGTYFPTVYDRGSTHPNDDALDQMQRRSLDAERGDRPRNGPCWLSRSEYFKLEVKYSNLGLLPAKDGMESTLCASV